MTALQISDLAAPVGYVLLAVGLVFGLGAVLGVWARPRQLERHTDTESTPQPSQRVVVIDVGGVPVVGPLVDDAWLPPGTLVRFPSAVYGAPVRECDDLTIEWARWDTPPRGMPVLTECGVLN